MSKPILHPSAGYAYLPHRPAFGDGVVATPGFEIAHVTFFKPLPFAQGLDAAVQYIQALGRPAITLCGVELRSPKPFTPAGFGEFNQGYIAKLDQLGLRLGNVTPMTRSNVVPVNTPPAEVVLYAFSYTLPSVRSQPTFVASGAADTDDKGPVRGGDTSADGIRAKARFVMAELQSAMHRLKVDAVSITCTNVYSAVALNPKLLEILQGAGLHGLHWYYSLPPIEGLSFEVDVRCTWQEGWM